MSYEPLHFEVACPVEKTRFSSSGFFDRIEEDKLKLLTSIYHI